MHCNVDLEATHGWTPLHTAVCKGFEIVTKQLISDRCNIDAQKKCGTTALYVATQKGHVTVTDQQERLPELQQRRQRRAAMVASA